MTSDLTIPFYGSSPFQHVKAFHNCVPTVPCPDLQHCSLDRLLFLKGTIICEQIQLIDAFIICCPVGIHTETPEEKPSVSLLIKLFQ